MPYFVVLAIPHCPTALAVRDVVSRRCPEGNRVPALQECLARVISALWRCGLRGPRHEPEGRDHES